MYDTFKLATDIFDDEKIKVIRKMPNGDMIFLVWIFLLTLTSKTNAYGAIYITDEIPYTIEQLANLADIPVDIMATSLRIFEDFEMIKIEKDGHIDISKWFEYQYLEEFKENEMQNK